MRNSNTCVSRPSHLSPHYSFPYLPPLLPLLPFIPPHLTSLTPHLVPISLGIILTSLLLAFTSNTLFSSVSTLLYSLLSYPLGLTATYLFTKSGLYTLSRSLATRSAALRERQHSKTATMKANALEAKVNFQHMNKIFREKEERDERELEMRPRRAVTSDLELAGVGTWGRV
jgi:hypothetical protein